MFYKKHVSSVVLVCINPPDLMLCRNKFNKNDCQSNGSASLLEFFLANMETEICAHFSLHQNPDSDWYRRIWGKNNGVIS